MDSLKVIIPILLILVSFTGRSQTPVVSTRLDTNDILIGDQTGLLITASFPKNMRLAWPVFQDTLSGNIEVIKIEPADTANDKSGNLTRVSQRLIITSFDSGYHKIPPLSFLYAQEGDTSIQYVSTFPLYLKVNTVEVDTTAAIKPIKAPLGAPLTFREVFPWIIGALLITLAAWFIYYYFRKRKKHQPLFAPRLKPTRPAHELALEGLEKLRHRKLWQSGKTKEYYTEMTDIVRDYIENRFNVRAVEMTTDEILDGLKEQNINNDAFDKLRQTLILADLVKFAKEQPLPLENDLTLNNSIDFVRETILKITETAGTGEDTQEETFKQEDHV
ncbi:MAG: hypothetical protein KKA81_09420 [Bacteroidetes bacterium]|nr:hypothetical protein [Bacteroidota bacterium]